MAFSSKKRYFGSLGLIIVAMGASIWFVNQVVPYSFDAFRLVDAARLRSSVGVWLKDGGDEARLNDLEVTNSVGKTFIYRTNILVSGIFVTTILRSEQESFRKKGSLVITKERQVIWIDTNGVGTLIPNN